MNPLHIAAIMFLSVFTQAVSGFGIGLISMALLSFVIDIRVAVPLVALLATIAEIAILARYRAALSIQSVLRLTLAALVGVPVGVYLIDVIDRTLMLRALGMVVVFYALYALLNLRLPPVRHPNWAFPFGFVGGVLGGLYNISGPAVIIYGMCRRWSPAEFRSNLQGFFIIGSTVGLVSHAVSGNLTAEVWQGVLYGLPALVVALVVGFAVDRFINPALFRRIMLVVLLLAGVNLLLTAG